MVRSKSVAKVSRSGRSTLVLEESGGSDAFGNASAKATSRRAVETVGKMKIVPNGERGHECVYLSFDC